MSNNNAFKLHLLLNFNTRAKERTREFEDYYTESKI